MRRAFWQFGNLFRKSTPKQSGSRRPTPRLRLEVLEDRTVLSATASSTIMGNAFIDYNGSGAYSTADFAIPGVAVFLNGTTVAGKQVNTSTTTNAAGAYSFLNVTPGTYTLSYSSVSTVQGDPAAGNANTPGLNILAAGFIDGGQNIINNIGFDGLTAPSINLQPFFTFSNGSAYPFASTGAGPSDVNFRSNGVPTFLNSNGTTVNAVVNGTNTIDLARYFSDPDILNNTIVQFNTTFGNFDVQMFDQEAHATVTNFLDYVEAGDYDNTIFHRLVNNFVIQGGGFKLGTGTTTTLTAIPTLPAVPSEGPESLAAGNTNGTIGTIAMALPGSNPNGGTDEFFINLTGSSNAFLDNQAFTVFGNVIGGVGAGSVVNALTTATPTNESSANGAFSAIPLSGKPTGAPSTQTGFNANDAAFPGDATAANFDVINSATILSQNERLTYKVLGITNSGGANVTQGSLVGGSSTNPIDNYLTINDGSTTGTATITVQATDQFGATATGTFTVHVGAKVPVVSSASVALNTAGDTLTVTPTETNQTSNNFQWFGNGTAINGATSASLALTPALTGEALTVAVTPINGSTPGATFTTKPVTVSGTAAPFALATTTVTNVTIAADAGLASPSPANASTLTATPTSNNDGAGTTYTYSWAISGAGITGSQVVGTSQTLNLKSLNVGAGNTLTTGDQLTLTVTPFTGGNAGTAFTTATLPVTITGGATNTFALSAPTVSPTTISVSGSTLTAAPAGTAPTGTLGFTFQWLQNGSPIAGQTSATLNISAPGLTVNPNDAFAVQITPIATGTGTQPVIVSGNSIVSSVRFVTNPSASPPTII